MSNPVIPDEAAIYDLALELFIGDNHKQSRESSIRDWEYFHTEGTFQGRVQHYKDMAAHALCIGYRKVTA